MSAILSQPGMCFTPLTHAEGPLISNALDEAQLIESAKIDPASLAQLYRIYNGKISRYVLRRVGNQASAEDLTADVFLAMVRYLPKYKTTAVPFQAWLYRLATNRINRWARWQRRRACRSLQDVACKRKDIEQYDLAQHVQTALLTLPVPFQSVLGLFYLEEMNLIEISQVLSIAVGTVKSRLSRGRELLRGILNEGDIHES